MAHIVLVAIAALSAALSNVPLTSGALPPDEPTPETLATLRDRALRMTVATQVNGRGPYSFTIDTGADRSVVSDRLASELALPPSGSVLMHGIIDAQPVRTVTVDRLVIGRTERRGIAAPVLPEPSLGATGLLGLDALANQNIILDFKRHRITIASSHADDAGDPETITVTGRSKFGQLVLTDASIGTRKIYAIIDTGAQTTVANPVLRKLLLGSPVLRTTGAELIGVTGSVIPAEFGSVPRIRLGGMTLTNMPVAYADAHTFKKFGVDKVPAILVGMDVLAGFERVAVDFRRRQVRFLVGDGAIGRG